MACFGHVLVHIYERALIVVIKLDMKSPFHVSSDEDPMKAERLQLVTLQKQK